MNTDNQVLSFSYSCSSVFIRGPKNEFLTALEARSEFEDVVRVPHHRQGFFPQPPEIALRRSRSHRVGADGVESARGHRHYVPGSRFGADAVGAGREGAEILQADGLSRRIPVKPILQLREALRSEERRVGKECR